jgi:hypothetical protein
MDKPLPEDWQNQYLDGELSAEFHEQAEQRLASDPNAHEAQDRDAELDHQLREWLPPPVLDEEAFLSRLQASGLDSTLPESQSGRRNAWGKALALLAVVAALVVAVVSLTTESSVHASVATLIRATGPVEVRTPNQDAWTTVSQPRDVALTAGTHLRTLDLSLCEVCTASEGIVRVNQRSEIAVSRADEVELVTGQLWCRASPQTPMRVCVASAPAAPNAIPLANMAVFTCPSNSETVWKVEDQAARCISVADLPTELRSAGNQTWTIDPGHSLACSPGHEPDISQQFDRLQAVSWQLPLLSQREPHDRELQGMLQSLLSKIGQTKMRGFYDEEIRGLGPAGTIPLLAFVRSPDSRNNPALRQRAMEIIADLAPISVRADLEALAQDQDPLVARLATKALDQWTPRKAMNGNRPSP